MRALELAIFHISRGTTYSWDLTTLISHGVPVSRKLRQKILAGRTTQADADLIRISLLAQARQRQAVAVA